MFNFRPPTVPGFRVKDPNEVPGFNINPDGSVRSPYAGASYADSLGTAGMPIAWPEPAVPDLLPQQWVGGLSCAEGHRECINSGRPPIVCLKALHQCSQNGVPTIFAPGTWGRPA
jgi:hypothetical protein